MRQPLASKSCCGILAGLAAPTGYIALLVWSCWCSSMTHQWHVTPCLESYTLPPCDAHKQHISAAWCHGVPRAAGMLTCPVFKAVHLLLLCVWAVVACCVWLRGTRCWLTWIRTPLPESTGPRPLPPLPELLRLDSISALSFSAVSASRDTACSNDVRVSLAQIAC
jgi:hypothetical protein